MKRTWQFAALPCGGKRRDPGCNICMTDVDNKYDEKSNLINYQKMMKKRILQNQRYYSGS